MFAIRVSQRILRPEILPVNGNIPLRLGYLKVHFFTFPARFTQYNDNKGDTCPNSIGELRERFRDRRTAFPGEGSPRKTRTKGKAHQWILFGYEIQLMEFLMFIAPW